MSFVRILLEAPPVAIVQTKKYDDIVFEAFALRDRHQGHLPVATVTGDGIPPACAGGGALLQEGTRGVSDALKEIALLILRPKPFEPSKAEELLDPVQHR
jgi:hypothetical protein